MKNLEGKMQIREVTVGCFLSATIVLVGVLWTLVVKNIELQKNSLLDNEEIQTIESETGWQQQGSDWYYYDESRNSVQNEWVEQYYYIGEDGKMVRNQYVDRFFVSQYGNWNPRFEVPYWLMHGEWKKNGNVWIYQYNGIVQTMDFSQIRSICRLGYDTSNEKTPPEQSKEAYRLAAEKGFTIVLCDLCFTNDHVPVCFHDEYINRIARDQSGQELEEEIRISDLTYEDTIQYDFGIYKGKSYEGTHLLKLEEMLELAQQLNLELYIEIKAGSKEEIKQAVELTKQYDLKLSWAGTKYDECSAVVEADDTARVSTMPRMIRDSEIEELLSLKRENNKVFFFTYDTAMLTDEVLSKLKKEGIPFEMGTIDSEIEIVNYLTENYQYCTGIESNKIVAANIDLDQVLQD